jgi:hypothetical protein
MARIDAPSKPFSLNNLTEIDNIFSRVKLESARCFLRASTKPLLTEPISNDRLN